MYSFCLWPSEVFIIHLLLFPHKPTRFLSLKLKTVCTMMCLQSHNCFCVLFRYADNCCGYLALSLCFNAVWLFVCPYRQYEYTQSVVWPVLLFVFENVWCWGVYRTGWMTAGLIWVTGEEQCVQNFYEGKLKEIDSRWDRRAWSRFIWLRMETNSGLLGT
jgi:hypothetical protein